MTTTKAGDSLKLETVRKAGLLERFHITRCALGHDTCVTVSAKYRISNVNPDASGSSLDRRTVLRALKRVVLAHPALCVQLAGDLTGEALFVRLPKVDLGEVVTFEDAGKTLEEVFKEELQKPFDAGPRVTKPLWRIVVRPEDNVVFSYHHGIADGGSGQNFHCAFMEALSSTRKSSAEANSSEEDESTVVEVPATIKLEPIIEERTSTAVSAKTFCKVLYGVFAPSSWQRSYTSWTAELVIPKRDLSVNVRLRKVEAAEAKRLVELCRKRGCTVTTFLHTLAVCVLSHLLMASRSKDPDVKKEKRRNYKTFSTYVAVSLRRFTGVSPLSMCDHVSQYHSFPRIRWDTKSKDYPPTDASFPWKDAVVFNQRLRRNLKGTRQMIGVVKYMYSIVNPDGYFNGKLGNKREGTLGLSNLGAMPNVKLPDDGERWEVEDVYFGQNDAIGGDAIKMCVSGSQEESIGFGYTWGVGAVDDGFVDAFVTEVHDAIDGILASSNTSS